MAKSGFLRGAVFFCGIVFRAPGRSRSCKPWCFTYARTTAQSRGGHRVLRYYLALHPAVFVGPAPWSLALRAPATGTKSSPAAAQGYRYARWRIFSSATGHRKENENGRIRKLSSAYGICISPKTGKTPP